MITNIVNNKTAESVPIGSLTSTIYFEELNRILSDIAPTKYNLFKWCLTDECQCGGESVVT